MGTSRRAIPLTDLKGRVGALLQEHAPWAAMLLATLSSLPGLWLPFLSDDWAQVDAVGRGPVAGTPFGDFRPLYMATLWFDRLIGGLSPSLFPVTHLPWIAPTAALVLILARRYTGDDRIPMAAG